MKESDATALGAQLAAARVSGWRFLGVALALAVTVLGAPLVAAALAPSLLSAAAALKTLPPDAVPRALAAAVRAVQAAALLTAAAHAWHLAFLRAAVHEHGLSLRVGWLARTRTLVPAGQIRSVRCAQSPAGRLLRFGNVVVDFGAAAPLELAGLARPDDFAARLLASAARASARG